MQRRKAGREDGLGRLKERLRRLESKRSECKQHHIIEVHNERERSGLISMLIRFPCLPHLHPVSRTTGRLDSVVPDRFAPPPPPPPSLTQGVFEAPLEEMMKIDESIWRMHYSVYKR